MDDRKILITGLNGLIGWHLYQQLSPKYLVVGTYAKEHAVFDGPQFMRVDLDNSQELRAFLEKIQPTHIIHTRGICDLDLCEDIPEMAYKINVLGTQKMLEIAGELKSLSRFIYLSTDHVFYGDEGAYSEESEPRPKHVYGRTKLEAEKLVQKSSLDTLIIRPGLVIGKSFQGNKGPRDFLFSRIKAKKPTHLFTDEWRTPIVAEPLAQKIENLLFSDERGIFHLADEEVHNRFDLGRKLAIEWGLSPEYVFPRLREEDKWAHIRPRDLSLTSVRQLPSEVEV